MNILFVSSIGLHGIGGSSDVQRGLVEQLSAEGHRVDTLTYAFPDQPVDSARPYYEHQVAVGSKRGLSSFWMAIMMFRLLVRYHPKLVISGVAYPTALLTYLVCIPFRVPYVVLTYAEDVTCVGTKGYKAWLLGRALVRAKKVMSISAFTCNRVQALGVQKQRSCLTPPWVSDDAFTDVKPKQVQALRERLGLDDAPVILTVARMTERKGHDTVIRALEILANEITRARYVIVGKGDPSRLHEIAAACGVRERVVVVDFVTHTDLPTYYHMADVHVMVSRQDENTGEVEGFGIVYLEAAAQGVPSVAGDAGGAPDAIVDGVTGLIVSATSPEQTAEALRTLLMNREQAKAMGALALERAWKDYRREQRINAMISALGLRIAPEVVDSKSRA